MSTLFSRLLCILSTLLGSRVSQLNVSRVWAYEGHELVLHWGGGSSDLLLKKGENVDAWGREKRKIGK